MKEFVIALYIRLSQEDTISKSLSIENQRLLLNAYVKNMEEFHNSRVLEFVDNGYSGTNFERPDVQKLLELVKDNKVDCIIVKDFSRFGRNSIETGYFIEKVFPIFNTRFISISDKFDTKDLKEDIGGIDVAFKYLINEHYSKDLSKKIKSSFHTKMRNGTFKYAFCIYGYEKNVDGEMIIDIEAAKIVKEIFDLSLQGDKNGTIAKKLNERNIITPYQYKKSKGSKLVNGSKGKIQLWNAASVNKVLRNETYTGTFVGRKYITKIVGSASVKNNDVDDYIKVYNHHEKIVDYDIFNMVQEKLGKLKTRKNNSLEYVLKSKVVCGVCQHKMIRVNKKPKFICNYSKLLPDYPCKNVKMIESDLEESIYLIIKKQLEVILGIENFNLSDESVVFSKINEYENEKSTLQKEKINLYEKFLKKEISLDDYKNKKGDLDVQLHQLEINHKSVLKEKEKIEKKQNRNDDLALISGVVNNEDKLTKAMVDLLIDKIIIYSSEKFEIVWKLKDFTDF